MTKRRVEILLVEDDLPDIRLTQRALKGGKLNKNLSVARDGVEALAFLRRQGPYSEAPRPDLILLDLGLPKKSGAEVLAEIKKDPELKSIPVVVLTTSDAQEDILETYALHANAYTRKPVDVDEFLSTIKTIVNFWLSLAMLPVRDP